MVAALPVLASDAEADWQRYEVEPSKRAEFAVGKDFIERNGEAAFRYFSLARWACIPLSLLGAWVCFCWAGDLSGGPAGLPALLMWCFCPTILGHGQLITPDVAAASLGVCASYLFWRWLKRPGWAIAIAAGFALGLTQLTKTTWILLFPLWPVL
jgi:4-amino-4-deoxy-L-arabinose transferase-like glycosyltransferase